MAKQSVNEGKSTPILLFLLALFLRTCMLLQIPADLVVFPRSVELLDASQNILKGDFTFRSVINSAGECVGPAYPTVLSIFYLILGEASLSAARFPAVLSGSLLTIAVYLLALELSGSGRTALFSGFFTAVYPLTLFWSVYVLSEQFFLLAMTLSLLFFVKSSSKTTLILPSFFFALLCALANSTGFLVLTVITAAFFLEHRMDFGREKLLSSIALLLFLFAMSEIYAISKNFDFRAYPQRLYSTLEAFLVWSFTNPRIKPARIIFLLALGGFIIRLKSGKHRALYSLTAGLFLFIPLLSECEFDERLLYMNFIPAIAVFSSEFLSGVYEKKKNIALILTALILFDIAHFTHNHIQSFQRHWEYRDLALWSGESVPEESVVLVCGSTHQAAFSLMQLAPDRTYVKCSESIREAMDDVRPDFIVIEKDYIENTNPEDGGILSRIYDGVYSNMKLVYDNTPAEREVHNREYVDALLSLNLTKIPGLLKTDLTSKKHTYIRAYKVLK